ncbi:uncharacterized protein F5Z01DRAFT_631666, partial [Emericellopsis atlantica]
ICLCDSRQCDFVTRRLETMRDHMPRHRRTASEHYTREETVAPLWAPCVLQTYFTAGGRIDYFVVETNEGPPRLGLDTAAPCVDATGPPPSSPERQVFKGLREDIRQAGRDPDAKAAIVEGPGPGRADKQRWLVYTGFLTHLEGLADAEIQSSFQLPKVTSVLFPGSVAGVDRP